MPSWLPPSPGQTSRDSWETSGSCQLQSVRDVFGACVSAGSVFPLQDFAIILCKMVHRVPYQTANTLFSPYTLHCVQHIAAAFSIGQVATG